jgi:hypothetical protein
MKLRWLATFVVLCLLVVPLVACGDQSSSSTAPAGDDATASAAQDDAATDADASPQDDAAAPDQSAEADRGQRAPAVQAPAGPRVANVPDQGPAYQGHGPANQGQGYAPPHPAPGAIGPRVPPQSATRTMGAGVSGDVGLFYDALARQGNWVRHPDYTYVWIPRGTGPGWRPYQEGRWVWTDDYGWYWESEEPFAWATYHYGRWDYDPDYGWFWVPGNVWAPAWVTWRFGPRNVGWAPIAPDRPGYAAGAPRQYEPPVLESWVFVDAHNFADPEIGPHVLPISRIGATLAIATDVRTPRYDNGRVLNIVAQRDEMRRLGAGRIETRELVYVGNQDDSFEDVSRGRVGIYRPVIDEVEISRPPASVVEVTGTERVVIREYIDTSGPQHYNAPSAALLDVLDQRERRGLVEARLAEQEAATDARIEQLQKERAALLQQRLKEAARLQAKLENERKAAMLQRAKAQAAVREQRRQRAASIKVDTQPDIAATPATPAKGVAPDAEANAKASAPTTLPPEAKPAQAAPATATTEAPANAKPVDAVAKGKPKKGHLPLAQPEAASPPTEAVAPPAKSAPVEADAKPDNTPKEKAADKAGAVAVGGDAKVKPHGPKEHKLPAEAAALKGEQAPTSAPEATGAPPVPAESGKGATAGEPGAKEALVGEPKPKKKLKGGPPASGEPDAEAVAVPPPAPGAPPVEEAPADQ